LLKGRRKSNGKATPEKRGRKKGEKSCVKLIVLMNRNKETGLSCQKKGRGLKELTVWGGRIRLQTGGTIGLRQGNRPESRIGEKGAIELLHGGKIAAWGDFSRGKSHRRRVLNASKDTGEEKGLGGRNESRSVRTTQFIVRIREMNCGHLEIKRRRGEQSK